MNTHRYQEISSLVHARLDLELQYQKKSMVWFGFLTEAYTPVYFLSCAFSVANSRSTDRDSIPLARHTKQFELQYRRIWASLVAQQYDSACHAGDARDAGWIPGSVRSPGGGYGSSLQCSCLESPMDGGAGQVTVHRVSKSQTRLKRLRTHTRTDENTHFKEIGFCAHARKHTHYCMLEKCS